MKKILTLFFAIVMTIQFSASSSYSLINDKKLPSGTAYSEIGKKVEKYVDDNEKTTAGMSLGIFDRDGIIYENNFGYSNIEKSIKVDDTTVYDWGSVSKLLIWISAMQLSEEKKLDLNEDVRNYLPKDFLKNITFDKKITMIDLMNHQAGFQETYFIQTFDSKELVSLKEALSKNQPKQVHEPGKYTGYSNWGAALAAYVIENVSGQDYSDYVRQNIFKPLDMKNTSIKANGQDQKSVSSKREELVCYMDGKNRIEGSANPYILIYPAGSVKSDLKDFITFARAVSADENKKSVLFKNKETMKKMYTPTSYYADSGVSNNHHGFFTSQFKVQTLGHGGNTVGCSSMLQFDPISGVGMVVMTNQAHEKIYNNEMYEIVFGKFSESRLAKIDRNIPKGLLYPARSIEEGPLTIMGALGLVAFEKDDLNKWWYAKDGQIYNGYFDFIVSTKKAVINILVLILFLLAGIYSLITLLLGCLIIPAIRKLKNRKVASGQSKAISIGEKKRKNKSLIKYNYLLTGIMTIIFVNLMYLLVRFAKGAVSGDIGSAESYMLQSILILIGVIGLIIGLVLLISLWRDSYGKCSKMEKLKYFTTILMSFAMIISILYFNMYQFWAI